MKDNGFGNICEKCKGLGGHYYKKRLGHDRGDYIWERCSSCKGKGVINERWY